MARLNKAQILCRDALVDEIAALLRSQRGADDERVEAYESGIHALMNVARAVLGDDAKYVEHDAEYVAFPLTGEMPA